MIAIGHSILMTALVWRPLYDEATPDDQSTTSSSATDVTTRGGALSVEETVQVTFHHSSGAEGSHLSLDTTAHSCYADRC